MTRRFAYDPALHVKLWGGELCDGMSVRPERVEVIPGSEQMRREAFRTVTRPRLTHGGGVAFIGRWIDGYEHSQYADPRRCWIAERDSLPGWWDAAAAAVPDDPRSLTTDGEMA